MYCRKSLFSSTSRLAVFQSMSVRSFAGLNQLFNVGLPVEQRVLGVAMEVRELHGKRAKKTVDLF
jgi:hypothetical protein